MSRQKLTLLKFHNTPDEMIQNRIDGLLDALCTSDKDYLIDLIRMIVAYIEENYEGEYSELTQVKLIEAAMWWREASGE